MDDELDPELTTWLLSWLGKSVPCELCRTETATADLREITVPGAVVVDEKVSLDFVVSRVVWVCPRLSRLTVLPAWSGVRAVVGWAVAAAVEGVRAGQVVRAGLVGTVGSGACWAGRVSCHRRRSVSFGT